MRCEESDRPYDENERDGKPPGKGIQRRHCCLADWIPIVKELLRRAGIAPRALCGSKHTRLRDAEFLLFNIFMLKGKFVKFQNFRLKKRWLKFQNLGPFFSLFEAERARRRAEARGNSSRNRDENRFAVATAFIVYNNLLIETFI